MKLDYAALQQLCSPILEFSDRLPDPQRDALGVAFGLSAGQAPSPFLVGLAVLGLLSEAAEQQPLLCVVDDAQWLDGASARALAFVAHRLLAERIALAFATRELGSGLARFPQLRVEPLGRRDARALLESVLAARLDEAVLEQIIAETGGNPLALLELRAGSRPASSPAVSGCLQPCPYPPGSSRASRGGWPGSRASRGGCCSWRRRTRSATLRFCGVRRSSLGSRRRPRTPSESEGLLTLAVRWCSAIRSCARRCTGRPSRASGARRTARWRTQPILRSTRIAARGTVGRPRLCPTKRWPATRALRGAGAGARRPCRRRCLPRRAATLTPAPAPCATRPRRSADELPSRCAR